MTELIKAGDLSNRYCVSTRTLRYYEEIGLIQSRRTKDYAYRMYDGANIKRLEQILILRKLNIGIKDIQRIFNTAGSEVVLEVLGLNQTVDAKAIIQEIFAEHVELIDSVDSLEKQLRDLNSDLVFIDEKADFYRNYLQKDKQDRSRYINVHSALKTLLAQHENAFHAIQVEPKIELSRKEDEFLLWDYEGDIDTIFTNLITNAYKALKKASGCKYFSSPLI